MSHAEEIINGVINLMPARRRPIAREVLECRYLAQMTEEETAEHVRCSVEDVLAVMRLFAEIGKRHKPSDFSVNRRTVYIDRRNLVGAV